MDTQQILVYAAPEARELLIDNECDVIATLKSSGLDVERGTWPADGPPMPQGAKGAELVILASAISAPLVAAAIARILDAIGRNKGLIVTEKVWAPAHDDSGKPLLDGLGQPLMQWREVTGPAPTTNGLMSSTGQRVPVTEHITKASILGITIEQRDTYR